MMQKNRDLVGLLKARLAEKRPLIQVVIGPRQVGKTTALKAALGANDHYINADYPTPLDGSDVIKWWKKAKEVKADTLAIDEVQKISNWSSIIKKLWDDDSSLKLVLTGSSALLVEKGLKETLAGRFELIHAEHWNYSEALEVFGTNLEEFIQFGLYPGSMRFFENLERWGSYIRDSIVEPALGRDLLQLHPIENPALLRQLFAIAVDNPAQVISLQKLVGKLQNKGAVATIQSYLEILSQGFLVTALEKYSSRVIRVKKSSPKLIVHDNSLCRAFERPITQQLSPEDFGRYFENAVGARFIEAGWDTFYWKERDWEVDFVVLGPQGQKWAIEVKSKKCRLSDLNGLKRFCQIYPEFQPKLISLPGEECGDVETLPVEEALGLARKY